MNITVEQLKNLKDGEYSLLDMRSDAEREYGSIPNSVPVVADELLKNPPADKSKKYVVYCNSGKLSADVVEELEEKGYKAYNLVLGYAAWLKDRVQEQAAEDLRKKAEHSLQTTFRRDIWGKFKKAVWDYKLINDGDKVGVCISGGKDSMLMAKLFQELKKYSKFKFDVEYIVMDPGYNSDNRKIIEDNAKNLGIPVHIFESDIFESVYHIERYPCYLCARMRRGHLYHYAQELGCNKIALGHHYDDVIETILMGMLYGAQMQTMMPRVNSANFEGMKLIRPMYLIREADIKAWRDFYNLQFIQCACKFTDTCTAEACKTSNTGSKRKKVKELIARLAKEDPEIEQNIFKSAENVNLSTVISYKDKHGKIHRYSDEEEQ